MILKPVIADAFNMVQLFRYFFKLRMSHSVVLFAKELGLHKTGVIGKWFVKSKATLWQEYVSEVRLKYSVQKSSETKSVPSFKRPMKSRGFFADDEDALDVVFTGREWVDRIKPERILTSGQERHLALMNDWLYSNPSFDHEFCTECMRE